MNAYMRKIRNLTTSLIVLATPFVTAAATIAPPRDFKGLVGIITNIIGIMVSVIFALTFLVFMWGTIKHWIIGGGDVEGVESGKKIVVTGIFVMVVMFAIWGILYVLQISLFGY